MPIPEGLAEMRPVHLSPQTRMKMPNIFIDACGKHLKLLQSGFPGICHGIHRDILYRIRVN